MIPYDQLPKWAVDIINQNAAKDVASMDTYQKICADIQTMGEDEARRRWAGDPVDAAELVRRAEMKEAQASTDIDNGEVKTRDWPTTPPDSNQPPDQKVVEALEEKVPEQKPKVQYGKRISLCVAQLLEQDGKSVRAVVDTELLQNPAALEFVRPRIIKHLLEDAQLDAMERALVIDSLYPKPFSKVSKN